MTIKTIFLDRDGIVNKDVRYLYKIKDFEFVDGIFEACLCFHNLGYQIIIVTNQSGIFRGYYNESHYQELTQWMLSQFEINNISILDIFHCPHGPNSTCNCRKPKPGMFLSAKKTYDIDMKNSWMIGDKETDIIAANAAGIKNTILVRYNHNIDKSDSNASFFVGSIKESIKVIVS